ncbi:MAG: PEP-CTERM sorting domain-containing protein [Chlorobaculum sp.]|nr:PEP-CTERM sorting domain-containing protein [Chlorobaculum sp.]
MKKQILSALAVAASLLGNAVTANAVVLTFEGLADQQAVENYYNGGAGGSYGISFSNAYAGVEGGSGGFNAFSGEPSPFTAMAFANPSTLQWNSGKMNVSGGFDTQLSFYYSSPLVAGIVTVYDGLNGVGTVLYTGVLAPTASYNVFNYKEISFSGTAHSVAFSGATNYPVAYDNITINAVPEPSTALLFGTGILTLGWYGRKRKVITS